MQRKMDEITSLSPFWVIRLYDTETKKKKQQKTREHMDG